MRFQFIKLIYSALFLTTTLLTACGGGGGGGGTSTPGTFTVSVTVTGLMGSVVLQNNGGDDLTITSNTTVPFATKISASYNVTVLTQPISSGQTCTITNGSGTATANVTNVTISCAKNNTPRYAYTANTLDNSVSTYMVNSATGRLKYIGKLTGITSPLFVTVDPSGRHLYMLNSIDNNVAQYSINADGSLSTGAPIAAGTAPKSITVDPYGKFAYVADSGSNQVSAYTINPGTGALSPVTGSPFSAGTNPQSVIVDPSGKFAYVVNTGSNAAGTNADISAYSIDQTTGVLTQLDCTTLVGFNCHGMNFITGVYPQSIAIDPTGNFAYVTNSYNGLGGNSVSQYSIDINGALTPITTTPVATGNAPVSVTIDSVGKYVYVANSSNGNSISQFAIGTNGGLIAISGAPATVATGIAPFSITIDPSSKYVYTSNQGSNNVSQFSVGANGSLTPLAPATVADLAYPSSIAITAGVNSVQAVPKFAYVANRTTSDVSAYQIVATGSNAGGLSPINCSGSMNTCNTSNFSTTGNASVYVTVDPTGEYAYVANAASNDISAYKIDAASGMLSQISCASSGGSTCNVKNFSTNLGITPTAISVDPTGQYLYVATSGRITQYTIGSTGALTEKGSVNALMPASVAVDPSGQYLYAVNQGNDSITQYTLGVGGALPSTATTTLMLTSGSKPHSVAVDPSGSYIYVTSEKFNNVSQYKIGPAGALPSTATATPPTGSTPLSVAIDPSGQSLYVANFGSANISQFSIGANATLSSMTPSVVSIATPTGTTPLSTTSVAVESSGRFAYVTNNVSKTVNGTPTVSSQISPYSIDAQSGLLTPIGTGVVTGSSPVCVTTTGTWQ